MLHLGMSLIGMKPTLRIHLISQDPRCRLQDQQVLLLLDQSMAPHVCIIGAGVSGLRCATVLLEHDYEVTIIEARDRIGGRVCNVQALLRDL